MATPFRSSAEFREVMGRLFGIVSDDPVYERHRAIVAAAYPHLGA